MRIMGLDIGTKTIGVAVSDPLGLTAQGVEVIRRTTPEEDLARLQKLAQSYQVEEVVVGLPKNMNNTIGPSGEMVLSWIPQIEGALHLPVATWDERLTTVAAERALLAGDVRRAKRKQVIDRLAATLILQGYLDYKRIKSGSHGEN